MEADRQQLCIWLNQQLGRPNPALADLIDW